MSAWLIPIGSISDPMDGAVYGLVGHAVAFDADLEVVGNDLPSFGKLPSRT